MANSNHDNLQHGADQDLLGALEHLAKELDQRAAPPLDPQALLSHMQARRRMRGWKIVLRTAGWGSAAAAVVILAAALLPSRRPQNKPAPPPTIAQTPAQPQEAEGLVWPDMPTPDLSLTAPLPSGYAQAGSDSQAAGESTGVSLLSLGESRLGDFSFTVPSVSLPPWTERSTNNES